MIGRRDGGWSRAIVAGGTVPRSRTVARSWTITGRRTCRSRRRRPTRIIGLIVLRNRIAPSGITVGTITPAAAATAAVTRHPTAGKYLRAATGPASAWFAPDLASSQSATTATSPPAIPTTDSTITAATPTPPTAAATSKQSQSLDRLRVKQSGDRSDTCQDHPEVYLFAHHESFGLPVNDD